MASLTTLEYEVDVELSAPVGRKRYERVVEKIVEFLIAHNYYPPGAIVYPFQKGFAPRWAKPRVIGNSEDGCSIFALTRICPECGRELLLSEANWYWNGSRPYSICADCHREGDRDRYRKRIGQSNENQKATTHRHDLRNTRRNGRL